MTNTDTTAECMVCGATFAQDQNLFDYCATCIEHEKAHRSPSGCLEACRFCAVSDDDADAAVLRELAREAQVLGVLEDCGGEPGLVMPLEGDFLAVAAKARPQDGEGFVVGLFSSTEWELGHEARRREWFRCDVGLRSTIATWIALIRREPGWPTPRTPRACAAIAA